MRMPSLMTTAYGAVAASALVLFLSPRRPEQAVSQPHAPRQQTASVTAPAPSPTPARSASATPATPRAGCRTVRCATDEACLGLGHSRPRHAARG